MNKREDIYKITSIILMLDQFIKIIVNNKLTLGEEIVIIPKFFSLIYLKNTGAAFSILKDNTVLLVILSVIIIIVIDKFIKSEKSFTKMSVVSLGLILGGIFGNLIDRIIHHGVIDYLSFTIISYRFPVFNLADTTIIIGIVLLIINMFLDKKNKRRTD